MSDAPSPAPIPPLTPDALRARVLHRDDDVLVIDKPAGLAVHAAGRVTDHLDLHLPALAEPGERAPRLAHRLDRDTAGCLVLGRTDWALKHLGRLFAEGGVRKTYWAVSAGAPEGDSGVVDYPLLKLVLPGAWNIVAHPDGQPALTEWRVLGRAAGMAWLELSPRTGRTHQLRVHMAAIGCPLVGEPYYGPERRAPGALHLLARSVAFRLPDGRPEVEAAAPPPLHMRAALAACGWTEEETP